MWDYLNSIHQLNSTGDVDDNSVSDDSDNSKNEKIIKKYRKKKKEKLVILLLLLVKIQYQNWLATKGDTRNVN